MKPTWCLASNNKHKIEELQAILGDRVKLNSMSDLGLTEDIPETGESLEENAHIKAEYVFKKLGLPTLADDSGLEIKALGGRPGVYSARYAGEHGNHEANMAKVLTELGTNTEREASFKTVLALHLSADEKYSFEGEIKGEILKEKRGTGGFGYDPLFVPRGYNETFAEMKDELKNSISHRKNAVKKLVTFLEHLKK